jgi:hypothetical protein
VAYTTPLNHKVAAYTSTVAPEGVQLDPNEASENQEHAHGPVVNAEDSPQQLAQESAIQEEPQRPRSPNTSDLTEL